MEEDDDIYFLKYKEYSVTLLLVAVCSYYPDIILNATIFLRSYGGKEQRFAVESTVFRTAPRRTVP